MKLSNVLLSSMLAISANSMAQRDSINFDSLAIDMSKFKPSLIINRVGDVIEAEDFIISHIGPAGEVVKKYIRNYCGMG